MVEKTFIWGKCQIFRLNENRKYLKKYSIYKKLISLMKCSCLKKRRKLIEYKKVQNG